MECRKKCWYFWEIIIMRDDEEWKKSMILPEKHAKIYLTGACTTSLIILSFYSFHFTPCRVVSSRVEPSKRSFNLIWYIICLNKTNFTQLTQIQVVLYSYTYSFHFYWSSLSFSRTLNLIEYLQIYLILLNHTLKSYCSFCV